MDVATLRGKLIEAGANQADRILDAQPDECHGHAESARAFSEAVMLLEPVQGAPRLSDVARRSLRFLLRRADYEDIARGVNGVTLEDARGVFDELEDLCR